ncbi:hypothetical protein TNIN_496791 [Trichonephila inaurata madagascariensis]|uniref:Uncharacterized protein n=1 Tax=Trichonephila inaurata madagascariensis TaxID=2747483 RepID=A0A8X7CAG9_9ARAC|nr:hypothetical protein TNIN_496791 [Trichonephila inaurata madagascariensis]
MYNCSPGHFVKSVERKRENDVLRRKRKTSRRRCRKSLFLDKKSTKNYGVSAEKPDLSNTFSPKKRMASFHSSSIRRRNERYRKKNYKPKNKSFMKRRTPKATDSFGFRRNL